MYKEGIGELGGIGWSMMPASIYITKNLSVSEKIIWGRINGLKNPFGYCTAKNRWLASQLDVKRETMSKIITDMVDKKYLSRVLVYRKGKDEILIDSLSGNNKDKVKGYKLVDRRLIAREIHEDCYDDIEGLGGSAIPPSILCNKKIKHSHKMLWGRLYYLRQAKGYCWADNEWIAERSPYTRGSISNMISDMVAAGVLKRTMVYSNGEEEILENSWENNTEKTYPSGYDFIGRRLVTVEIEDTQNDNEHEATLKTPGASLKNPGASLKNPARELDLELDLSIRKERKEEIYKEEKKEKRGIAAVPPLKTKDSVTITEKKQDKALLVSAFPGCGKTWLYTNSGKTVLDSDSSTFDKSDFPQNYIEHIKQNIDKADIILISTHADVREELVREHLPFTLVYPCRECKNEYIERYKKRGSDQDFVALLDKMWDTWIDELEAQKDCEHIVLWHNAFLSDAINNITEDT